MRRESLSRDKSIIQKRAFLQIWLPKDTGNRRIESTSRHKCLIRKYEKQKGSVEMYTQKGI